MAGVGELPNGHARPAAAELLESVSVEASEVSDARAGLSVDGLVRSSSSFKENNNLENDSAFYEKFLPDDDSYWDDLGAHLTVLRMVSNSIIKGRMNAVAEEAAENIASKEAELTISHDRLQPYKTNTDKFSRLETLPTMPDHLMTTITLQKTKSELQYGFLDANVEYDYSEHLSRLKIAVEEQLQRLTVNLKSAISSESTCRVNGCSSAVNPGRMLPQGNMSEELLKIDERVDAFRVKVSAALKQISDMFLSLKASICEHQWGDEFQREVSTIVLKSYTKDLHNNFEMKLWEQTKFVNSLNKNWKKTLDDLSAMRHELEAIAKSLCSSEHGLLLCNNSHDFQEGTSGKRKDHIPWRALGLQHLLSTSHHEENGTILLDASEDSAKPMLDVAESLQLKCMTKEEVIAYYKSEMIKMRRQHDSALQEKTEELFSLKREFLREKGSSPFRKDKEFELLRKKISEILLKLDDIFLDSEKLPAVHNNHEELCGFKDRIDALFFENQYLRGLLTDKRKEVICLSSQVSNAASQMSLHSSVGTSFLKQIEKLRLDMEDVKVEASIRDELCKDILRDFVCKHQDILRGFVSEHQSIMVDLEIHSNIMQEVSSIISKGVADDALATINPVILKHFMEKASLEALLLEKEKALCLEIKEKEKLKQAITLLMEEKENLALEVGSTLMQQKEQFDLIQQELYMMRHKVNEQEILISEKKLELDSIKGGLDETLLQANQYQTDIRLLNQKNRILWDTLEEAEKENNMLHDMIEEKQNTLSSLITKEKKQEKQMESMVISVMGLSKASIDFENRLREIFYQHEPRLKELSHQCNQLLQHANLLKTKGSLYKHMLEIKCSNLQKAEAEVDLLGDEVDALLSLLGKIYIALDHYSPVLQHYPGVMEILKLVQRELNGENNELT